MPKVIFYSRSNPIEFSPTNSANAGSQQTFNVPETQSRYLIKKQNALNERRGDDLKEIELCS